MADTPLKVLHVEVGGSYGGSLRLLELYLTYSRRSRFEHDVLLYYPTPGAERLQPFVRRLWTLYDHRPARFDQRLTKATDRVKALLKAPLPSNFLIGLREWAGLIRSLPTVRRLIRALRTERYDVVHINNTPTYQAPTLVATRIVGIPVVANVLNPIRPGTFSRRMLRLTTSLVTMNRCLEKELQSWRLTVGIQTCFGGVELPKADASASAAIRESLLPSGGTLIGAVGRLDEQKGYGDLIHAARSVMDLRPHVRFAIAGDGPFGQHLRQRIADLGLTGRFHLCGFREDIANFLTALDIFVSSSLWEGGPLVLVEAMLLRKPVVTTNVGVSPEIIVPGKTGELVPASDPDALASALLAALAKKDTQGYDLEEARRKAATLTDPRSNAQTFDEIFERSATTRSSKSRSSLEPPL